MKQQGFTLTETLVTTAIIAIISSAGMDTFQGLIQKTRAHSDFSELLLQVRTARQYAITHSQQVVLCPSFDSTNCINNWKAPKLIFFDSNDNKKRDSSEAIERRFNAINSPNSVIKYSKTQIRFNEQGVTHFFNGTLAYCLDDLVQGLVISRLGRIRIAHDLNGDNIPDVSKDKTVSCL